MSGSRGIPREGRIVQDQVSPTPATDSGPRIVEGLVRQQQEGIASELRGISRLALEEGAAMSRAAAEADAQNEPIQRDEQGRIVVPEGSLDRQPLQTVYQARRREAMIARYGNEVSLDATTGLAALRQEHRDDPEAFLRAARQFRTGMVQGMPTALRQVADQQLERQIGQHYLSAVQTASERATAESAELGRQNIERLGQDLVTAMAGGAGGEAERAAVMAAIDASAGVLRPGEAQRLRDHWTRIGPAQATARRAFSSIRSPEAAEQMRQALASGDPEAIAMATIVGFEGARYDQQNAQGSSAWGKYQFTHGAWEALRRIDPSLPEWRADAPSTRPGPEAQERGIRVAMRSYRETLDKEGIPVTAGNMLGVHFMGPGGYPALFRAARDRPNERITDATINPRNPSAAPDAVAKNGEIFQRGGQRRTNAEVLATIQSRAPDLSRLSAQERTAVLGVEDDAVRGRMQHERGVQQAEARARRTRLADLMASIRRTEDATAVGDMSADDLLASMKAEDDAAGLLTTIAGEGEIDLDAALRAAQPGSAEHRMIQGVIRERERQGRRAATDAERTTTVEAGRAGAMRGVVGALDPTMMQPQEAARRAQRLAEFERGIAGLPLDMQARRWTQFTRILERENRTEERVARQESGLQQAMVGQRARFENNAVNQEMGVAWLRERLGPEMDFTKPGAVAEINNLARAGIIPQQVMFFMGQAIRNRDPKAYEAAAEIHRALTRDENTKERYFAAVDAPVRAAYEGAWEDIQRLPRDGEQRQARIVAMMEAGERQLSGDPAIAARVMATLGDTAQDQRKKLQGFLREHAPSDTHIPPEMEAAFNSAFVLYRQRMPDEGQAAQAAWREVSQGWVTSQNGLPRDGALTLGRAGWFSGRDGRYMPAREAPETHTVPTAGGGRTAAWQQATLDEAVRRHMPTGTGRYVLGTNAFFKPVDAWTEHEVDGQRIRAQSYEIWFLNGVPQQLRPLVHREAGRPTGEAVRIPLAREAAVLTARFAAERPAQIRREQQGAEQRSRMFP